MTRRIGRITHYYDRIGVAVLDLTDELSLGDRVLIRGKSTEFTQLVVSMEIEHQLVQKAGPGMSVALKVNEPVNKRDAIFLLEE